VNPSSLTYSVAERERFWKGGTEMMTAKRHERIEFNPQKYLLGYLIKRDMKKRTPLAP
jgi:hypothetical protein